MSDKIQSSGTVSFEISLRLTEVEARALSAITLYGAEGFLKTFYGQLGRHYLKPHADGVKSLFAAIQREIPKHLGSADAARRAFREVKF